jgi:hypothetical protein
MEEVEIEPQAEAINITTPANITKKMITDMGDSVKITDSVDGLDLYCYVNCGPSDSDSLKKCRGVVFKGDELVMSAFQYTNEYTCHDYTTLVERLGGMIKECSIFDSYEGTLIRMFYANDKWYTGTNRKLDANKSKWASSNSFGYSFAKALEEEVAHNDALREAINANEPDNTTGTDNVTDTKGIVERFSSVLDKKKKYMFMMLNDEHNRIVCDAREKGLIYHVGTVLESNEILLDCDINVPRPAKRKFDDIDLMLDYVEMLSPANLQGVIIFAPDGTQHKVYNSYYFSSYNIRGNEPSIKFRYLQLRMDLSKRYELRGLYPNFIPVFEDYENIIYAVAKQIYNAYISRFINNQYIKVPPEEYNVVRECHAWHLADRSKNKITLGKVQEILNQQVPTNLNKMIRRFYNNLKIAKEEQQQAPTGRPKFLKLGRENASATSEA